MNKSIKNIINEYNDLHYISIKKPTRDRNSWTFEVHDKTSRLNGVCSKLIDYKYRIITLQRGDHFFIAYKLFFDDGSFEYMVDPKKSIHRTSVKKYIESLINYTIWSNDISYLKNDPSFKYTHMEMVKDNVSNYLDLCVKYGDYSSIGSGLTRDVRNLIVLDIDVNCEKPENKKELERLILLFSNYDFTPNFYIINHESKHVQLQWLIKSCDYKQILWKQIHEKINYLESTKDIHKELYLNEFNFVELSPEGLKYRKFTRGLTELSDKYKFGDPNYTFWKAKNLYSAFQGKYNLELKMPKVIDGEITYLTYEEMSDIFKTKENRQRYYDSSPTMEEIYDKTNQFMYDYMNSISEKSIKKVKDDLDELFDEPFELYDYKTDNFALSRNTFVFNCTRTTTWDIMREMNCKSKTDILKLSQRNQKSFKSKIKKLVKSKFEIEDNKYGGEWPGTTNKTKYTSSEFNSTFNNSFDFAVEHFTNTTYDDLSRTKSLEERILKKKLRHVLILYLQSTYHKIKNKDLLSLINDTLTKSKHEKISNTTLKRDLKEIEKYDETDKQELYKFIMDSYDKRQKDLMKISEMNDKKEININKKRLQRLWLENIDEIRQVINN